MDYAKVTGQNTANAMDSVNDILARFNKPLEGCRQPSGQNEGHHRVYRHSDGELQSADKARTRYRHGISIDESMAMLGSFHKAGVDTTAYAKGTDTFVNNTAELSRTNGKRWIRWSYATATGA